MGIGIVFVFLRFYFLSFHGLTAPLPLWEDHSTYCCQILSAHFPLSPWNPKFEVFTERKKDFFFFFIIKKKYFKSYDKIAYFKIGTKFCQIKNTFRCIKIPNFQFKNKNFNLKTVTFNLTHNILNYFIFFQPFSKQPLIKQPAEKNESKLGLGPYGVKHLKIAESPEFSPDSRSFHNNNHNMWLIPTTKCIVWTVISCWFQQF